MTSSTLRISQGCVYNNSVLRIGVVRVCFGSCFLLVFFSFYSQALHKRILTVAHVQIIGNRWRGGPDWDFIVVKRLLVLYGSHLVWIPKHSHRSSPQIEFSARTCKKKKKLGKTWSLNVPLVHTVGYPWAFRFLRHPEIVWFISFTFVFFRLLSFVSFDPFGLCVGKAKTQTPNSLTALWTHVISTFVLCGSDDLRFPSCIAPGVLFVSPVLCRTPTRCLRFLWAGLEVSEVVLPRRVCQQVVEDVADEIFRIYVRYLANRCQIGVKVYRSLTHFSSRKLNSCGKSTNFDFVLV
jgi:hypothetical protein